VWPLLMQEHVGLQKSLVTDCQYRSICELGAFSCSSRDDLNSAAAAHAVVCFKVLYVLMQTCLRLTCSMGGHLSNI
jgi:hypothetical protein